MCVFLTCYTHTLACRRDRKRRVPAHKHSLRVQTLWPDRLPPINTDQFSSSSSPDCLCGGEVYASGYQLATLCTCSGLFSSHWASDTLLIPSVRIYSPDCHYSKSHYSPALLHHDNTLQHAPLHPIRPAKTQNTAHQGGGQRKGILRLQTQTAFSEQALQEKYACLFMACKDVQNCF